MAYFYNYIRLGVAIRTPLQNRKPQVPSSEYHYSPSYTPPSTCTSRGDAAADSLASIVLSPAYHAWLDPQSVCVCVCVCVCAHQGLPAVYRGDGLIDWWPGINSMDTNILLPLKRPGLCVCVCVSADPMYPCTYVRSFSVQDCSTSNFGFNRSSILVRKKRERERCKEKGKDGGREGRKSDNKATVWNPSSPGLKGERREGRVGEGGGWGWQSKEISYEQCQHRYGSFPVKFQFKLIVSQYMIT